MTLIDSMPKADAVELSQILTEQENTTHYVLYINNCFIVVSEKEFKDDKYNNEDIKVVTNLFNTIYL